MKTEPGKKPSIEELETRIAELSKRVDQRFGAGTAAKMTERRGRTLAMNMLLDKLLEDGGSFMKLRRCAVHPDFESAADEACPLCSGAANVPASHRITTP